MESKIEVGLEHIQQLDIRTARRTEDLIKRISTVTGKSKQQAEYIFSSFFDNEGDFSAMNYDKKNENYDIAMAVTGGYDADIVRKACNWVNEHKEYFGKEILEIGCDCGFMTTFLAKIFPDSHITSIDKNQSGISIAKKNVESFGLSNVTFECSDAKNVNKKFDTVFSMRTMHENMGICDSIININDFQIQAKVYKDLLKDYANTISKLLSENGQFISIERSERNPLFLGWLEALSDYNLYSKVNSYEELECLEVGDYSKFQALVINHDNGSRNNPYQSFLDCATKYMDTTLPQYKNWEARCMFEIIRGEKIREDIYLGLNDIPAIKLACWTHKSDQTALLYLQDNVQDPVLSIYDISQKNDVIENMESTKKQILTTGCKLL